MQETWVRPLGQEDTLEEGMASNSSILAWRIPGTGEPGGLPSLSHQGSHLMHTTTLFSWSYDSYSEEGNGTPLQYSCVENPMDGGAWSRLSDAPWEVP